VQYAGGNVAFCSTAVSVLYAPECSQHVRGQDALSEIEAMLSDQQINP